MSKNKIPQHQNPILTAQKLAHPQQNTAPKTTHKFTTQIKPASQTYQNDIIQTQPNQLEAKQSIHRKAKQFTYQILARPFVAIYDAARSKSYAQFIAQPLTAQKFAQRKTELSARDTGAYFAITESGNDALQEARRALYRSGQ